MKKVLKTKAGYKYVEVDLLDCLSWGGFGVCDYCNQPIKAVGNGKGYLVWVLNSCICENCFNGFLRREVGYEEDLQKQEVEAMPYFRYHLGENVVEGDECCE